MELSQELLHRPNTCAKLFSSDDIGCCVILDSIEKMYPNLEIFDWDYDITKYGGILHHGVKITYPRTGEHKNYKKGFSKSGIFNIVGR